MAGDRSAGRVLPSSAPVSTNPGRTNREEQHSSPASRHWRNCSLPCKPSLSRTPICYCSKSVPATTSTPCLTSRMKHHHLASAAPSTLVQVSAVSQAPRLVLCLKSSRSDPPPHLGRTQSPVLLVRGTSVMSQLEKPAFTPPLQHSGRYQRICLDRWFHWSFQTPSLRKPQSTPSSAPADGFFTSSPVNRSCVTTRMSLGTMTAPL